MVGLPVPGDAHLHDGGAIVGDGLLAVRIYHQQVAAIGSQSRLYGRLDCKTRVDVGDDLGFALRGVGA